MAVLSKLPVVARHHPVAWASWAPQPPRGGTSGPSALSPMAAAGSCVIARLGPTGRGAAWLARLTGGQKVAGSNPAGPTAGEMPRGGVQSVMIGARDARIRE